MAAHLYVHKAFIPMLNAHWTDSRYGPLLIFVVQPLQNRIIIIKELYFIGLQTFHEYKM